MASELRPAARVLSPTLRRAAAFVPDLRTAFSQLEPIAKTSRAALPAATRALDAARQLLDRLYPLARELVAAAEYPKLYRRELITSWAKAASFSNATLPDPRTGVPIPYLRVLLPCGPESNATFAERPPFNRHNPYGPRLGSSGSRPASSRSSVTKRDREDAAASALNVACVEQRPLEFGGEA